MNSSAELNPHEDVGITVSSAAPERATWPKDGLEYLDRCPVCGSRDRQQLFGDLIDRLFSAPGQWSLFQCAACHCGYLDPRPSEATIGLAYAQYITHLAEPKTNIFHDNPIKRLRQSIRNSYLNHKYGYRLEPSVPWGFWAMYLFPPPLRLEWDHFARHLGPPSPGQNRLFDVGCGNGSFLSRARQIGWNVQGLEFDPQAAAAAKNEGLDVWVGDYRQAPFPPGAFDVITCHQVIEHIHDLPAFVQFLATCLKPQGLLWLGTPNFQSRARKLFGADWRGLHPPQHLTLFTPHALLQLLNNFGMQGHLLPRGYYEAHMVTQSEMLRQGYVGQENITMHKHLAHRAFRSLLFEGLAWLCPEQGSDLVVVARKNK